jgi:hypothetical protein
VIVTIVSPGQKAGEQPISCLDYAHGMHIAPSMPESNAMNRTHAQPGAFARALALAACGGPEASRGGFASSGLRHGFGVARAPRVRVGAERGACGKRPVGPVGERARRRVLSASVPAILDNGPWSKTPDGEWHNKGKDEVPNASISEHTFKYAVHLRRLDAALPVLAAHKLQIVALARQLPEHMGESLTVRVLYDGKPVQGALVQPDLVTDPDSEPLKTGADGTVTVKIRNQGLNVVVATLATPPANPAKTNRDEHLATLSFVLPHLPE